jgi:hypothetical protein
MAKIGNCALVNRLYAEKNKLRLITASMLHVGMSVPVLSNNGIILEKIIDITGHVGDYVDISVDDASNFYGNDVLSHNCIYEWRGALANAMEKIEKRFDCKVMPLNTTFRCGKAIVREANVFVPDLVAHPSNPEGVVETVGLSDLFFTAAKPGDAVISRTRAPLFRLALALLGKHVRVMIKGDDIADGLINTIEKSKEVSLGGFLSWLERWESQERERLAGKYRDREEFEKRISKTVDTVDVYKTLCASLDNKGTTAELISLIRKLCEKREGEEGKSVMLMTAHGSKGLEFDRVWMVKETFRSTTQEERNLTYVATTRAKLNLTYLVGVVSK